VIITGLENGVEYHFFSIQSLRKAICSVQRFSHLEEMRVSRSIQNLKLVLTDFIFEE